MARDKQNNVEEIVESATEYGNWEPEAEAQHQETPRFIEMSNEDLVALGKERKKEVSRLNRHIVSELKSEIKTVIIALNRAASLDELHEAAEFFADTSVDIKLVKRAIRALVKEGKLVESGKNSFELSQQKVDFYAALANLKKNPTRRLS